MKLRIPEAYNKIMEDSRLVRLPGHVAHPTDRGLWKLKSEYKIDGDRTLVTWCQCPMAYRFGCKVQIKLFDGPTYISLDVRGQHDADSHSPEKEKSKHLSVKQIEAIHTGVRISMTHTVLSFGLRRPSGFKTRLTNTTTMICIFISICLSPLSLARVLKPRMTLYTSTFLQSGILATYFATLMLDG